MSKLKSIIFITCLIFFLAQFCLGDESEEIDECELNNCNLHNHVKESCDVCHHNKFPNEKIKEKFGDDVRTCCAGHGYIFKDHCEVIFLINKYSIFFKDWDNPMTKNV